MKVNIKFIIIIAVSISSRCSVFGQANNNDTLIDSAYSITIFSMNHKVEETKKSLESIFNVKIDSCYDVFIDFDDVFIIENKIFEKIDEIKNDFNYDKIYNYYDRQYIPYVNCTHDSVIFIIFNGRDLFIREPITIYRTRLPFYKKHYQNWTPLKWFVLVYDFKKEEIIEVMYDYKNER